MVSNQWFIMVNSIGYLIGMVDNQYGQIMSNLLENSKWMHVNANCLSQFLECETSEMDRNPGFLFALLEVSQPRIGSRRRSSPHLLRALRGFLRKEWCTIGSDRHHTGWGTPLLLVGRGMMRMIANATDSHCGRPGKHIQSDCATEAVRQPFPPLCAVPSGWCANDKAAGREDVFSVGHLLERFKNHDDS